MSRHMRVPPPIFKVIARYILDEYDYPIEELIGPRQDAGLVNARRVAILALHKAGYPSKEIGRLLKRDGSTIRYHLKTLRNKELPSARLSVRL